MSSILFVNFSAEQSIELGRLPYCIMHDALPLGYAATKNIYLI